MQSWGQKYLGAKEKRKSETWNSERERPMRIREFGLFSLLRPQERSPHVVGELYMPGVLSVTRATIVSG